MALLRLKRSTLSTVYGFLGGLTLSGLFLFLASVLLFQGIHTSRDTDLTDTNSLHVKVRGLKGRIPQVPVRVKEVRKPKSRGTKHYTPGDGHHSVEAVDLRNQRIENFIADEVHAKKLVHYGLLVGEQGLAGHPLWDTWVGEVDQRDMVLYAGATSKTVTKAADATDVGVVHLPDVSGEEVEGPAHLASALKSICAHQIDNYQWFFLSHPNIYINQPQMHSLLQRLKGSSHNLIGRPVASGRVTTCCDWEQGFLISRVLLQKICPYLPVCLPSNIQNTKEDFNFIEKCTQDWAGYEGSRSLEVEEIFQSSSILEDVGDSAKKILNAAVIGYVSEPHSFYRMHHVVLRQKLAGYEAGFLSLPSLKQEVSQFGKMLNKTPNMPAKAQSNSDFALEFPVESLKNKQVQIMKLVPTSVSFAAPTICGNLGVGEETYACCDARQHLRDYMLQKQGYYSYRVGAMYSDETRNHQCLVHIEQMKLDGVVGYNSATISQAMGEPVALHKEAMKHIIQTYHFVIATQEGSTSFKNFLKHYHESCNTPNHVSCALTVIMYKGNPDSNTDIEQELTNYQQRTGNKHVTLLDMTEMLLSCNHALKVARTLFTAGEIIVYTSENVIFTQKFLNQCSNNIFSGKHIYTPIPSAKRDAQYYFQNIIPSIGPTFCMLQDDVGKLDAKLKFMQICSTNFSKLKLDANLNVIRAYQSEFSTQNELS